MNEKPFSLPLFEPVQFLHKLQIPSTPLCYKYFLYALAQRYYLSGTTLPFGYESVSPSPPSYFTSMVVSPSDVSYTTILSSINHHSLSFNRQFVMHAAKHCRFTKKRRELITSLSHLINLFLTNVHEIIPSYNVVFAAVDILAILSVYTRELKSCT